LKRINIINISKEVVKIVSLKKFIKKRVIILGAAGRDFHNFNMHFRDYHQFKVIAFTAAQIPDIAGRKYPKELAGKYYQRGIPIYDEKDLPELIKKFNIHTVYFAYSDVNRDQIMDKVAISLSAGANFELLGPNQTMVKSKKPVIAVCATRTGAGKGTVCRKVLDIITRKGYKAVAIRHPMPYGDLKKQICQKFSKVSDLDKYNTTLEEREEYFPYIEKGITIFSGVDYEKIIKAAEKENPDVIVFESGNNDISLIKPDLYITVIDPIRPEGIFSYPGEINVRIADLLIINKFNLADKDQIKQTYENLSKIKKTHNIIKGESSIVVDKPELVSRRNVVLVEDAPSITHGGISPKYAVSYIVAKKYKVKSIVNPKKYAVGALKGLYKKYPDLSIVPTYGYNKKQLRDLEKTLNRVKADSIIFGSYSNFYNMVKLNKPVARVTYELKEVGGHKLERMLTEFLKSKRIR